MRDFFTYIYENFQAKILVYILSCGIAIKFLLSRFLFSYFLEGDWAIELSHYNGGVAITRQVVTRCELVITGQRPGFQTKGILQFVKIFDAAKTTVFKGSNSLDTVPYDKHFLVPGKDIVFELGFVREFTQDLQTGEVSCDPQILPLHCKVTGRWLSSKMHVEVEIEPGYFLKGTAQKLSRTIFGFTH